MCHKLKDKRQYWKLTVVELAELSGISQCTIYRIESGDTTFKVNIATAEALADALDCFVEEMFNPTELSELGRPPHTGKPIGTVEVVSDDDICQGCFIKLPCSGICDTCPPAAKPRYLAAVG